MAHRSLATRIWGPAAYALRRHPGPGVPPPPLAAAAHPRFVGTTRTQAKPQSNIKRTQEDSVYVLQLVYLMGELEKVGHDAKQRMVELEQFGRQKKKAQKIFGFTFVAVTCMTVCEAKRSPAQIFARGTSP